MSQEDHPLFPEDIIKSEPSSEALLADISEEFDKTPKETQELMLESQLALRAASLGILTKLGEEGVIEADVLYLELTAVDADENPLFADISPIALRLSEMQENTIDVDELYELKKMSALAYAVGSISIVATAKMYGAETHKPMLTSYAQALIDTGEHPESTRSALQQRLNEVL